MRATSSGPTLEPDTPPASSDSTSSGRVKLPAPNLPAAEVAELVRDRWGLDVDLAPLGSQQDQNFLATAHGEPVGVVKITNPAFSAAELDAQELAAARIAAAAPRLRIATTDRRMPPARHARSVADTSEGPLSIRIIEYLGGGTLTGDAYLSPATVARMGELAARAVLALADFDHPGLDRVLQWDPQVADRVVDLLAPHHPDPARRQRVADAAAAAWAQLGVVAADLPRQAVHLDLTDDNVVCTLERGIRLPDGLIDFGDVTRSWAVAELAITISSVLHHAGAEPVSVLPAIRAFHELRPLSASEVAAIWPLVVLRGAVLVVSGEHQVQLDGGENAYAAEGIDREWRDLRTGDVGADGGHDPRHRRHARGRRRRRRSGRRHRRARPRARRRRPSTCSTSPSRPTPSTTAPGSTTGSTTTSPGPRSTGGPRPPCCPGRRRG